MGGPPNVRHPLTPPTPPKKIGKKCLNPCPRPVTRDPPQDLTPDLTPDLPPDQFPHVNRQTENITFAILCMRVETRVSVLLWTSELASYLDVTSHNSYIYVCDKTMDPSYLTDITHTDQFNCLGKNDCVLIQINCLCNNIHFIWKIKMMTFNSIQMSTVLLQNFCYDKPAKLWRKICFRVGPEAQK